METVGKIILTIISWIALAAIALAIFIVSDCDDIDIIITAISFVISGLVLALLIALGYAMYFMIWVT